MTPAAAEPAEQVLAAQREAQPFFGDPPVFCERYLPRGRHIEVQVMADLHGTVWAGGERECSIQRRHQKIIEEGPVTAAPYHIREDMERCARALARSVGYVGAATIEFLYALESREYCFLELNPRLQVRPTYSRLKNEKMFISREHNFLILCHFFRWSTQ